MTVLHHCKPAPAGAAFSPTTPIGLALSGGGVRALVFHLGVLERLARQGLLPQVAYLSTVSGGSLAAGLVFRFAAMRWPDADTFRRVVVPRCRTLLTRVDLQRDYLTRVLLQPWTLLRGRAATLAASLRARWQIDKALKDLPSSPQWVINATTYETGKNWRFSRKRMGDYLTGYVLNPDFPLNEAMAASAAVPGLIGPLRMQCRRYSWHRYPEGGASESVAIGSRFPTVRLWDGGVYDNLGAEALYKRGQRGFREGVEFLIVSDASRPLGVEAPSARPGGLFFRPATRLIDVATDQVRALRARDLVEYFEENPERGVYLRMGNTAQAIIDKAQRNTPASWRSKGAMPDSKVSEAAELKTTLRRLGTEEFDNLFWHGYEVADVTLSVYCPTVCHHLPFCDP
jgi:NTE family protein